MCFESLLHVLSSFMKQLMTKPSSLRKSNGHTMILALFAVLGILNCSWGEIQIESFRYSMRGGSFAQYPDPFVITKDFNISGSHIECCGLAMLTNSDAFIFDGQEKSCKLTNQSLYTIDFKNQEPHTKVIGSKYDEFTAIDSSLVYVYVSTDFNQNHPLVFINVNSGTPYEACTYEMDDSLAQDVGIRLFGGDLILLGNALHFCFPWWNVRTQNKTVGSDQSIGACYVVKPGEHTWKKIALLPDNTVRGAFTFKVNETTMWIAGGVTDAEFYYSGTTKRHGDTTRTTKFYHYDGNSGQIADGPNLPINFSCLEISWLNNTHIVLFGFAEDATQSQKYFVSRWPPTDFSWSHHDRPPGTTINVSYRPSAKLYQYKGKSMLLFMASGKLPWLIDPTTLVWVEAPPDLHQKDCQVPYIQYIEHDVLLVKHEAWGQICLYDGQKWHSSKSNQRYPQQLIYANAIIPRNLFCS